MPLINWIIKLFDSAGPDTIVTTDISEQPATEAFQLPRLNEDFAKRALDELFSLTRQYRSSVAFRDLLTFVGKFRYYSPFNAMLVHVQMPGATYVAPPKRWLRDYSRRIKAGARPLVILQPKGPVMFVFDVSDTEAGPNAPPLPPEVEKPFETRSGKISDQRLAKTIANAKRDGVLVSQREAGSQSAGEITSVRSGQYIEFFFGDLRQPQSVQIPYRYQVLFNSKHSNEAKYATLSHELGHLYCGHLGTPNEKWWPNRVNLEIKAREFEAESVCYLVCARTQIDNPSHEYLSGYLEKQADVPIISLDSIMKAVGLIEEMGDGGLKPRKEKKGS